MITWHKGERILSAGTLKIWDDKRVSLADSRNGVGLVIRNVGMEDQGEYACEVNLKDKPIRISHRLAVLGES